MAPASRRETLGNLLRERVELAEWGPRGPRRVTVRDRRPVKGGILASEVTVAKDRPPTGRTTWKKGGTRVEAGRDHRGRFIEGSWTYSF
jgi:hypothetical protein